MKKKYFLLQIIFLFLPFILSAQNSTDNQDVAPLAVLLILICLLIACVYLMGNHLVRNYADKLGVDLLSDTDDANPFGPKAPSFVGERDTFKALKKGFDIPLAGEAPDTYLDRTINTFAVQPPNYRGIRPIPKILVEIGQHVQAGEPLFFDKDREGINFVSPVSGEVVEINRGQKRAITEVVVLADKDQQYKSLQAPEITNGNKEQLIAFLKENGAYPLIVERPYGILPEGDSLPNRVFISTFNSAPLAPSLTDIAREQGEHLQAAIDVLAIISDDNVHLGLNVGRPNSVFASLSNCQKHWFQGPHPAGNVGIQIHQTRPIGLEEKIWTLDVQSLITLGKMFTQGRYDASRTYAITGDEVERGLVSTKSGANIADLLGVDRDTDFHLLRVISGDVLTGGKKKLAQFANTYDDLLSVIPEGDYYEMLGWLMPSKLRPSKSKTYIGNMFPDMTYNVDTNTHGEPRAFVVTGQYESVLPVDTHPQHLFKAILSKDFERMQGLGIHELLEEDVALCEFVCTSKQELQSILREGLDYMREQM